MKKTAISALAVGIMVVVAYIGGLAWQKWCVPRSDISVSVNGQIESKASAATCPNGAVIVQIPGQTSLLLNLTDMSSSTIPGTQFHDILGLTFSHDTNPQGVSIKDRVKIESDLNVVVSEQSIAYDDLLTRERIQILVNK
ncbi:MAG: hypothetical protein ABJA02_16090 [Acidobacteriota bacterium]